MTRLPRSPRWGVPPSPGRACCSQPRMTEPAGLVEILPAGVTLTTALQCVSDEECALGATGPGPGGTTTAQILTTTDGGSSWISHDLPAGIGSLYLLSCPSLGACSGLASPAVSHLASTFVETHDGGASWSRYAFSEDQDTTSISCASSNQCLVVGDEPSTSPGSSGYGVSWTTDDGGQSWHSDVTKGFSLGVGSARAIWTVQHPTCASPTRSSATKSRSAEHRRPPPVPPPARPVNVLPIRPLRVRLPGLLVRLGRTSSVNRRRPPTADAPGPWSPSRPTSLAR